MPHPAPSSLPWSRLLRVTWPFVAATVLLVAAAWASLYLVGAGRAYVEGESLWSKGQKDALQHLARYTHSCDAADLRAYRRQIALPLADREARLALTAAPPDTERAANGFLRGGNHPDEIGAMLFLHRWFGWTPPFQEILRIWSEADTLLLRIDALADTLAARAATPGCGTEAGRDGALAQLLALIDQLTPLQRRFSQTLGETNRRATGALAAAMAAVGALLGGLGLAIALRTVRHEAAVERRLAEQLRGQRHAMATLRRLLAAETGDGDGGERAERGRRDGEADDMLAVIDAVARLMAREVDLNERLAGILALLPDALVSLDAQGHIVHVSGAFEGVTGLSAEGWRRQPLAVLHAALAQQAPAGQPWPALPALLARLRSGPVDLPLQGAGGAQGGGADTVQAELHAGRGIAVHQVLRLRDVTRERAVERMKSEFIAAAAHELRTPLTSIHAAIELLLHRTALDERQREMLEVARRQSGLLTRILGDLLDVERLEQRGPQDLHRRPLDLASVVAAAVQGFVVPPGREAPALRLPPGHWPVQADEDKLHQVVNNLLSNAYKNSHDGSVVVSLVCRAFPDGRERLGLTVRDHGIGMTRERRARLGERFYRGDPSGAVAGTGLGFNIIRQICALHGGSVEVDSAPGAGTEVRCWLPAAPEAAEWLATAAGRPA